ncbi:glycosyltransferase family 2 protein [Gluconacetobacter sp. Hr-1-5]|uniref:glycosyltransferase family 2 protein n=1 Tax=Gluconacetobacter sp. Hr-1-5 TaxID=3395370 RepID=UPI003B520039
MTETPLISIVICTFNRPQSLTRLIDACIAHASPNGLHFEIVIADNSPSGYGSDIVKRYEGQPVPVRYVSAQPANISIARNRGIATAKADIIAFLDDDVTIDAGWLDRMYATLDASGADCALSAVSARPAEKPPVWDEECRQFVRSWPMSDGTPIPLGRSGGCPVTVSTNASIWKRWRCFKGAAPFDPTFGKSGGEDLDLFLRLRREGLRIVWCGSAVVFEWVPANRMRFRYLFLRAFSGGQVFAAAVIHNTDHAGGAALGLMLRGLLQCVGGCLLLLSHVVPYVMRGTHLTPALATLLLKMAGAAGKCFWFYKIPLYPIEAASQR